MKQDPKEILKMIEADPSIKEEMMHIHFTADLHHGHPKIVDICSRPTTRETMNDWLVKEVINKYVGKNDELYIIGDLSFAKRQEAEKFIDRLNGNKWLIIGNHDKNIKNSTRFVQITQRKRFTFKRDNLKIEIILDHYPIISWDKRIHGSWHLYGHVHCRPIENYTNNSEFKSFDVGIDRIGIWRPYNLYEICQIMYQKSIGHSIDDILKTL